MPGADKSRQLRLARDVEQRAPFVGSATERGNGHVEGDATSVTGIDTREQGLDELVGDRTTEARIDEVTDRHVVELEGGDGLVGQSPHLFVGEQSAHRLGVGGRAHDRARGHRPAVAPRDDRRADRGRVGRLPVDPDLLEEGERLGPTGEHGLGADVDEGAADPLETQLAADPVGGLVDRHRDVGAVRASSQAAVSPAMPPPMTATLLRM